jgi:hypothetical protein
MSSTIVTIAIECRHGALRAGAIRRQPDFS